MVDVRDKLRQRALKAFVREKNTLERLDRARLKSNYKVYQAEAKKESPKYKQKVWVEQEQARRQLKRNEQRDKGMIELQRMKDAGVVVTKKDYDRLSPAAEAKKVTGKDYKRYEYKKTDTYKRVKSINKYEKKVGKAIKKFTKYMNPARVEKVAKKIEGVQQAIGKMGSSELKAQSNARMAALRARKTQMSQLSQAANAEVQAAGGQAAGVYPNKFLRILKAREIRLNEMDANRRFHAPIKDFNTRLNVLHDLERERRRADEQTNSILRAHELNANVTMDFCDTTTPHMNIAMAPNIFASDNPLKTNIMDNKGRPNVLQVPVENNIMVTKKRLQFF
jgi:hypothetical protein